MSLRGRIIAAAIVAGLAVGGALAWPLIEDQAARALERRLATETGRTWTIGSVGLRLLSGSELVAHDVTVADRGGGGGKIRQIRLADPLALLGSGSSMQAVAEGIDLRWPTARPARTEGKSGDGAAKPSGTISAMRAVVRAPKAELVEAGRTLVASAEAVDLTLTFADSAPRTDVQTRFETGDYNLEVAATLTAGGQEPAPLTLKLEPSTGPGHRVEASAKALFASDTVRIDAIAGTIDREPFSGNLSLALAGKPRVALELRLDALTLIDEANPAPLTQAKDHGLVVPVKPDFVPDVRWFEGFDAKGSVSVAKLHLGSAGLTGVTLTGTVKDGTLDAALASAALYEGQARGRYVLAPDANRTGRHQISLSLGRVRVLPFLADIAGARGLDGSGTARLDLQATGTRSDDLLRSATGSAELSVTDGRIDGLDLAGAFGLLPGRAGDKGGRPGSLGTRLDRLAGRFEVSEGQAFTNDLQLKTMLIEATGLGRIDIPGRSLDFRFKPQAAPAGGDGQSRPRARVDVPVHVSGPWTNPSVSADLSGLAENPAGAIQQLQDLGTNLLGEDGGGKLGESLGGLLDSFIPKPDTTMPERSRPGRRRSLSPEQNRDQP